MTPLDLDHDLGIRTSGQATFGAPTPPPPVVLPTDIPNLIYWGDSAAARVTQSSGNVSAYDVRAKGVVFTNFGGGTGTQQPFWSASAGPLATECIQFNSTGSAQRLIENGTVIAGQINANSPFTYLYVGAANAAVSGCPFGAYSSTLNSFTRLFRSSDGRHQLQRKIDGDGTYFWDSLGTVSGAFFAGVRYGQLSTAVYFIRNGTIELASSASGSNVSPSVNTYSRGSASSGSGGAPSLPFPGRMYMDFLYRRALTDTEIGDLRTYAKSVYPSLP